MFPQAVIIIELRVWKVEDYHLVLPDCLAMSYTHCAFYGLKIHFEMPTLQQSDLCAVSGNRNHVPDREHYTACSIRVMLGLVHQGLPKT